MPSVSDTASHGPAREIPAEQLSVLLDVGRSLASTLDLAAVLQTAVDGAVSVIGLQSGAIYLLEDDSLFLGATTPALPADFPRMLRRAPIAPHLHISESLRSATPVFVADSSRESFTPEEQAAVDQRKLATILYVPLMADAKPVGVFILSNDHVSAIPPAAISLCETVASFAAVAIANAKLFDAVTESHKQLAYAYQDQQEQHARLRALATQISLAEEKQRRNLAVELHDRIVQPLAVLKMKFDEVESLWPQHLEHESYALAVELLCEAIEQSRSLCTQASPPFIFERGLQPALEWLTQGIERHGIDCGLDYEPTADALGQDARLFVFQAVRELVNNAVKHADASSISIVARRDGNDVLVRVTDDGRGFDTAELGDAPGVDSGFGIFSLRERALHLSGSISVASALGVGTTVAVRVPATD